jgi:hypothetical protein
MRRLKAELRPHPTTSCEAVSRIGIEIDDRDFPRALRLLYRIDGEIARIRLPPPGFARRSDGLWQHTCFEAFLRPDASDSYHEFNFAPSGDWALYRFGARRSGRSLPELPAPPAIECGAGQDRIDLSAQFSIAALPELAGAASFSVGVAAVVETEDGSLSYWALAHGGEEPDFHDPSSFALRAGFA